VMVDYNYSLLKGSRGHGSYIVGNLLYRVCDVVLLS